MFTVYILLCVGGTYYIGIAKDVARRFDEHKAGKGARYTRAHRPLRIVYRERKRTRGAALKREYALKQLTRKQKQELILSYQNKILSTPTRSERLPAPRGSPLGGSGEAVGRA